MKTKCRLVVYSREILCALVQEKELPFEPGVGMRLLVKMDPNGKFIILVIEQIDWVEILPDLLYISCGVEQPGTGQHDGERFYIPFGSLSGFTCNIYMSDNHWKKIEENDHFFTARVQGR